MKSVLYNHNTTETKSATQQSGFFFQPKLNINQPNDVYEQEADAMADKVMHMSDTPVNNNTFFKPAITPLQRKENNTNEQTAGTVTEDYVNNLSGGRPLNKNEQHFFESRMGYDFSNVRLHTDGVATKSAQALNALAYTSGNNIVFNEGNYAPGTNEGKRLLSHELTHVVQQNSSGTASIQRDDTKPVEKTDVSLLLDDDPLALTEARSYAPVVIRATNGEDAKKKLAALGKPIKTLYVVSHSNRLGEVEVISGIGTISWVKLSDFSKDLKGALPADKAPEVVDFRGCKLGDAPSQMETFRQNINAQKSKATNCWSMVATVTPLTAPDGSEITAESQIPAGMGKQFNDALMKQINGLKTDDGRSVKNCIFGLATGETADRNFAKIRTLYFKGGGNISAGWVSPEFNKNWQEGSMCVKDMTESTSPCKIVTAQPAPAATEEKK